MRVLHLNDCAFVARTITAQATSEGRPWRHLVPEQVRPSTTPTGPLAPLVYAPYVVRRALAVGRSDVVHVHYGTSAPLVRQKGIPRRPYVLSLHGTDIRTQWHDPRFRPLLQRGIDAASIVLYTNLDTAEATLAVRPDALHLPQAVDPRIVPAWARQGGDGGRRRVVFAPRWSPDKGVTKQLSSSRRRCTGPTRTSSWWGWTGGPGRLRPPRLGSGSCRRCRTRSTSTCWRPPTSSSVRPTRSCP
ncbi:glycosyltransferase [Salana multivorans]